MPFLTISVKLTVKTENMSERRVGVTIVWSIITKQLWRRHNYYFFTNLMLNSRFLELLFCLSSRKDWEVSSDERNIECRMNNAVVLASWFFERFSIYWLLMRFLILFLSWWELSQITALCNHRDCVPGSRRVDIKA